MSAKSLSFGQFKPVDASALIQQALNARIKQAAQANAAKAPGVVVRSADSVQLSSAAVRFDGQVDAPAVDTPSPIKLAPESGEAAPIKQAPIEIIAPPATELQTSKAASLLTIAPVDAAIEETPGPQTTTSDPVRLYGDVDLAAVQSGWGASIGDRAYSVLADANGDGTVNFDDQNFILANWGQAAPSSQDSASTLTGPIGQQQLDAAQAAFGARSGDANFVQGADANGDGVIDFNDITQLLANWGQTSNG